jgi:hypothetical protein
MRLKFNAENGIFAGPVEVATMVPCAMQPVLIGHNRMNVETISKRWVIELTANWV